METKRKRWSKRLAIFVLVAVGAMGIGVAFGAWTVGGGGSGYAQATSAQNLTTNVATTSAELYPGITNAALYLSVNNPNPFPVTVTGVNPAGPAAPDALHGGCTTTGVAFAAQLTNTTIAPNSTLDFTVGGVSMSNASSNGCQGATFDIPVAFDATS